MINIHVILLVIVLAVTLVMLAKHHQRSDRSLRAVTIAVVPFLLLGITSSLLMSATGGPIVEWLLPGSAVGLLGLCWNSRRGFEMMRWCMLMVAVILCLNFTALAHSQYTASPETTKRIAAARQKALLNSAANLLRKSFGPEATLPAGPLSEILKSRDFTSVDAMPLLQREWHTWFTRLYRVVPRRTTIWCPGGGVDTASRNLGFLD